MFDSNWAFLLRKKIDPVTQTFAWTRVFSLVKFLIGGFTSKETVQRNEVSQIIQHNQQHYKERAAGLWSPFWNPSTQYSSMKKRHNGLSVSQQTPWQGQEWGGTLKGYALSAADWRNMTSFWGRHNHFNRFKKPGSGLNTYKRGHLSLHNEDATCRYHLSQAPFYGCSRRTESRSLVHIPAFF